MQRPVMDPTFVEELAQSRRKHVPWRRWVARATRWFCVWLLTNPLTVRVPGEEARRWSVWSIVLRIAVFWAILLPILLTLTVLSLVYRGSHPAMPSVSADPGSQGVYYETANFTSGDGTPLTGWLVPAIDARRVLDEKDRTLRLRRPAIVLVHGFGRSMQQMLPLVRPLHEQGVVILMIGARGAGTDSTAAQTFGLNESKDVSAAVELLRQTAFVDRKRIAVAGIGSGANAALIAASHDESIKAIILAEPIRNGSGAVTAGLGPRGHWLGWLQPVCRRVFEVINGVEIDQLDIDRYANLMKSRPTLLFETGDTFILSELSTAQRVKSFCRQYLQTDELPRLGAAR